MDPDPNVSVGMFGMAEQAITDGNSYIHKPASANLPFRRTEHRPKAKPR